MCEEHLSQEQLYGLMKLLKEALSFFEKQCYPKVAFFNDWCMYCHLRSFRIPQKRTSIGHLLDVLEPYIPIRLSDENYEMFMQWFFDTKEPQLSHKAKMDFVVTLQGIENPAGWEQAFEVCETIRSIKEELSWSVDSIM